MKNYFDEIKEKIKDKVELEKIEIIDNSNKHKGHKFFSKDKFHLKLIIKSFKIEPFGSAKTNSHFLFFDLRNSPIPEIVPPVPTPATKA